MAASFRDWTRLPPELLDIIVTKLGQLSDYIRFCGVCSQWRKVALGSDSGHKQSLFLLKSSRRKLPMLMIKTQECNNDTRELYSVSDGMTYNLKLPRPCKDRFFGSSLGWLMYFEENQTISILNPLNRSCISLPKFEGSCFVHWRYFNPSWYLCKGILSSDPIASPNYTVAVIYNFGRPKLAVYKSGDMQWKFIHLPDFFGLIDIAFHKGSLYGVNSLSGFVQIDIGSGSVKTMTRDVAYVDVTYLVESQGDLLLVQRFLKNLNKDGEKCEYFKYSTRDFKIFKLVHEEDSANWVQIFDIGEQALFLGGNHSVSVSALKFPGCLSNSIYYTSQVYLIFDYECCGPDEDAGIFSLEDESIHSHHILETFEWHAEPPMWFVPNPDLDTSFNQSL